jgi:hypothetical protein
MIEDRAYLFPVIRRIRPGCTGGRSKRPGSAGPKRSSSWRATSTLAQPVIKANRQGKRKRMAKEGSRVRITESWVVESLRPLTTQRQRPSKRPLGNGALVIARHRFLVIATDQNISGFKCAGIQVGAPLADGTASRSPLAGHSFKTGGTT